MSRRNRVRGHSDLKGLAWAAIVAAAIVMAGLIVGCGGGSSSSSESTGSAEAGGGETAAAESGGGEEAGGEEESAEVVVASYGGEYEEAQIASYWKPFEEQHPNVTVVNDPSSEDGKLEAMVESGSPTWDLAIVDDAYGLEANAEFLEPINYSVVNKSEFLPGYADKYRVGADIESTVLAYNSETYGSQVPQGFADFFNLEKFPGKRAIWKYAAGGVIEAALIASGEKPDELYPLDLERAFKELDKIKSEIVWWTEGAQSQQLISSGETPMALVWGGRAVAAAEEGVPVKIQWNEWTTQNGWWAIPKGAKNAELAQEMIAFATSPEQQAAQTELLPYGPTNKNALPMVSSKYKADLPTSHYQQRVVINSQWWSEHYEEVNKAFQEWLLEG
jgi:putative spermidine/putrescine transport system substrate-binding protein